MNSNADIMRFLAVILILSSFAACHSQVRSPLLQEIGWVCNRISTDQFRIIISVAKETANDEGMAVASEVALSNGYKSFIVIADKERPDSGTYFSWSQSYSGSPGLMAYNFGSSFLIQCYREKPRADEFKIDAKRTLDRFWETNRKSQLKRTEDQRAN